ncbi:MAG: hypothetical protein IPK60_02350 [Sandaracinaceae bacterium]|nr:hypothetical protein [Sandaracinaceae bacterium]
MRQSPNFLHAITICLLCAGCGAAPPSRAAHASGADGEALDVEDAVAELVSLAHPDAGNLIQTCGVARLSLIPEAKVSYVGPYVSHLPWSILRAMRPSAYVQFSTADEGASFGTLLFSVRASQRVVQRAFTSQSDLPVRFESGEQNRCTQARCEMFEQMRVRADWINEHVLRLRAPRIANEAEGATLESGVDCADVGRRDTSALIFAVTTGEDGELAQSMHLGADGLDVEVSSTDAGAPPQRQTLPYDRIREGVEAATLTAEVTARLQSGQERVIPVSDVDVSDNVEFHIQVGLRAQATPPAHGDVIVLLTRRIAARPDDLASVIALVQLLGAAEQWEQALGVVRRIETVTPQSEATAILAQMGRTLSFHGDEADWQRRLVRDGVATPANARDMMNQIRTVFDFDPTSYDQAETRVRVDFAIRDAASSIVLTPLRRPERFPKRGFVQALFALVNNRASDEEEEHAPLISLRIQASAIAQGERSDDAYSSGVIEFADATAHVIATSEIRVGALPAEALVWADHVHDGPVDITLAVPQTNADAPYRIVGVVHGELRGDDIVVTNVSPSLQAVPWDVLRRYIAAPVAPLARLAADASASFTVEARNPPDETALLSELGVAGTHCERVDARHVRCDVANRVVAMRALSLALATRLPPGMSERLLAPTEAD